MKKIIFRLVIALVVVLLLVVLGIGFFIDSIVKKGVETIGPQVTKVDVKLAGVNLSFLSGSGTLKGFVLGNPSGYKTPHAISVGSTSLSLKPSSVFSDKVVVKSLRIESPEINYEGDVLTDNLRKILDNISGPSTGATTTNTPPQAESGASKKLQVDEFIITGAKVNVHLSGMVNVAQPVTVPDIHLKNLGQGPEGITAEELSKVALTEVREHALKYAVDKAKEKAMEAGKEALKKATDEGAKKLGEGLNNLLKKKD